MAANPMKIRASNKDGVTEVKVLISHEMETGQRKDASGAIVPAWFITELTAKHNDRVVLGAEFGTDLRGPTRCEVIAEAELGDVVAKLGPDPLRPDAGMTQEDLSERCGLFRTYMSRIETGQANPTLTMIHALAGSLRVPVVRLFESDPPGAEPVPRAARPSRGRVR